MTRMGHKHSYDSAYKPGSIPSENQALNAELEEDIYIVQPEGFEVKGKEHLICKLWRSKYGLKQSPRSWNTTLDGKLKGWDFLKQKEIHAFTQHSMVSHSS